MHPFPWRGEGPWVGVEASPYEIALPRQTGEPEGVRWEWLESPSRRLGIIDIRGFILCVAQFVTRICKFGAICLHFYLYWLVISQFLSIFAVDSIFYTLIRIADDEMASYQDLSCADDPRGIGMDARDVSPDF